VKQVSVYKIESFSTLISRALRHKSMQRWYLNMSAYAAPLYINLKIVSLWCGPSILSAIIRLCVRIKSRSVAMLSSSSMVSNSFWKR
jgi:hypothetical protein